MIYFIYVIAAVVGFIAVGTIVIYIRAYIIRKSRKNDKAEDFMNYFVSEGMSGSLVRSVYSYLQDWMGSNGFAVRPQDDIGRIYGIVDEDLDEMVVEIAEANNLVIPLETDYRQKPVETVEDLIRFIASFPEKDFCE
jgi:hypothetical protein